MSHADRAAGSDAGFVTEDVPHQVAVSIDDSGVIAELGRGVDHAEGFDQPLDAVERAEVLFEGGEDRQSHLSSGLMGVFFGEVDADLAGDERLVGLERAVSGNVQHVPDADDRLVDAARFRGGWKFQVQFRETGVGTHQIRFLALKLYDPVKLPDRSAGDKRGRGPSAQDGKTCGEREFTGLERIPAMVWWGAATARNPAGPAGATCNGPAAIGYNLRTRLPGGLCARIPGTLRRREVSHVTGVGSPGRRR